MYYKARGSADGIFPKCDRAATITDVKEVFLGEGNSLGFAVRLAVLNPDGLFSADGSIRVKKAGSGTGCPSRKISRSATKTQRIRAWKFQYRKERGELRFARSSGARLIRGLPRLKGALESTE